MKTKKELPEGLNNHIMKKIGESEKGLTMQEVAREGAMWALEEFVKLTQEYKEVRSFLWVKKSQLEELKKQMEGD